MRSKYINCCSSHDPSPQDIRRGRYLNSLHEKNLTQMCFLEHVQTQNLACIQSTIFFIAALQVYQGKSCSDTKARLLCNKHSYNLERSVVFAQHMTLRLYRFFFPGFHKGNDSFFNAAVVMAKIFPFGQAKLLRYSRIPFGHLKAPCSLTEETLR